MAPAARLLPPMARTRRRGRSRLITTSRFFALGAVETLGQVADRRLKRCHFCRQGRFALDRPRVLRLPVICLPRELDIGLLRQHYALLSKRGGVVAVARRQIRDGVDIGVSALHGERYTRFFLERAGFYDGGTGFAETLHTYSRILHTLRGLKKSCHHVSTAERRQKNCLSR